MPTVSPSKEAASGQPRAEGDALFEALYDDLRRMARREVWRNGARGFVSTRTLVHEAWLDIRSRTAIDFDEPKQFLAYAAQTMRGLVIDRVRAAQAQKRGGGLSITSLDTNASEQAAQPEDLQHISDALDQLALIEPDLANVVDLKFFCGFTLAEVARMQGVSERTVQRSWQRAKLLLHRSIAS